LVLDEGWIHSPQTLSSILVACEVAVDSDDVPPLQNYADSIYAFRERISPGEITRRIHLEDWHRYMRAKDEAVDTASEMEDMFARIRHEIGGMERRSAEFKQMVDELARMVKEMPNIFTRIHASSANGFTTGPRIARAGARSRLVRSPSDLTPTPLLANSRARLPTPLRPPAPPGSPRLQTTSGSPSAAAVLASISASASLNRLQQMTTAPSRTPPPPRAQRYAHFHRRFFHRSFFASRTSNPPQPRTPSPRGTPSESPPGTPALPGGPGFHGSREESSIGETRTRLPPPLETSPIPYRAPGQRF